MKRDWITFIRNIRGFHSNKIEEFVNNGSNYKLDKIIELLVTCCKTEHLNSGGGYIKLPEFLQKKKAVVNMKNLDNECFKWAVLSALYPVKIHPERVRHYFQYEKNLNFHKIRFPVQIKDIRLFEKNNPGLSVNIYAYANKKIVPMRLTDKTHRKHINLLLIQRFAEEACDDDLLYEQINSAKVQNHYCLIKNLSRLFNSQINKQREPKHICNICS